MINISDLKILIEKNKSEREENDLTIYEKISKEVKNRNKEDTKLDDKLIEISIERKSNDEELMNKINFLKDRLDKIEAIQERDYFLRDGFLIKESNKWYNVNSNENFEVIGITKSLPPTKIMIKYNKCEVYYNIVRDLKGITTCYFYNGYYYIPENRRLLRYSPSGIVTLDYIICRVTITGEESKNNLLLKIEK